MKRELLLSEEGNKKILEESELTAQISENLAKPICLGNVCSVAPLEEAIDYIIDSIVADRTIPNVKVKKL
jgi:hypothetical protein